MAEKKKNILIKLLSVLFTLIAGAVFAEPYLNLAEGYFISASLKGLHSFCVYHFGFFARPELQQFTLVPFVLFFVLITILVISGIHFVYSFYLGTAFAGFYVIAAYIQKDSGYFGSIKQMPAENWQYIGYLLLFGSLFAMVFLSIKEIGLCRGKADKTDKSDKTDKAESLEKAEKTEKEGPQKKTNNKIVSSDAALFAITSVKVPDFKSYPNFSKDSSLGYIKANEDFKDESSSVESSINPGIFAIASLDGDLHRQAMTEMGAQHQKDLEKNRLLSNIFKPRNLRKKLEEDEKENRPLPTIDDNICFDLTDSGSEPDREAVEHITPISIEQPEATQIASNSPVFEQQVIKHIVDEGSEGDESPEEAAEKYRRMKEEEHADPLNGATFDYVSGVGGLKSSKDGKYVYDSSKFRYKFPPETLLRHYETSSKQSVDLLHDQNGHIIVDTLAQFRIETQLVGVQHGPTFTLYELALAKGIRVNTVLNLADNIAMDLAVPSVRILAPIPGRSAIGIEVPNKNRDTIGFDMMMPALKSKTLKIPMVLGKTITGDSIVIDLAGAPHLLIAGTTGSGKSVCVNSLICSILFTKTPKEVRMILVDPKMVELTVYNDIPHLLTPVITDAKKAIKVMAFIVEEMERRMSMFSMVGARKIEDYNQKIKDKQYLRAQLPYIVVIVDEFADLMMVVGKELESYIKRITAMARFTGIHLVLATQRPSADVITGIIKSNIPTQIAFAVSNQINSRIILDANGAEKLLGKGDMLYASASSRTPNRIQGAYIDPEIEDIVSFVKTQGEPDYIDEAYFEDDEEEEQDDSSTSLSAGGEDLYMRAWKIVADRGEATASYLQRRLSIGYNRAANLIEQLEENGCIGPARGSKPREILRYPDSRSEQG